MITSIESFVHNYLQSHTPLIAFFFGVSVRCFIWFKPKGLKQWRRINPTVENAKEKLDRWLKDGITTPGGKLPSERELGELLGIKRMTLRQALLNLEAESKSSVRIVRGGS
ncbi:GntR family transcriptional regulator [Escherichia coli]|uniref:GntR family transcriptional regulator n=1 Tax=Escherichia coli TaxID=562 RepID=A0A376YGT1_ECOLX|nr:GntR family transcriptional regulator [Escherichia coli]